MIYGTNIEEVCHEQPTGNRNEKLIEDVWSNPIGEGDKLSGKQR
jgi:hypothetical protein